MNCAEVQSLLLQSDELLAPDGVSGRAPEHVANHVRGCAACSELARKLRRLESAVRSLPGPIHSTEARLRFEERLRTGVIHHDHTFPHDHTGLVRVLRLTRSRLAIAAVLFLCIGGGIWAYLAHQNQAVASAQTLDQLVAWNLSLTQSDSPDERQKLYSNSADSFQQKVGHASLNDDDRKVADELMQNGKFLAGNCDPVAEADHFSKVADLLVGRMDHAAKRSPKALEQLRQTYFMVVEKGIRRNLDRADATGVDSPEHERRIEKIIQRNIQLQSRLETLLQDTPAADKAQLRKDLNLARRERRLKKQEQQKKIEESIQ